MKILLTVLGLVNGGYMLLDGIYVMLNGKYIGPKKPGPWANMFYKLDVDVFKLGPLFIVLGIGWFIFLFGFWANQSWAFAIGLLISVITLWYLPLGTLFSAIVLIVLLTSKRKLGL